MAARYYTLVASLPALEYFERAKTIPINRVRLEQRLAMLTPEDAAERRRCEQLIAWRMHRVQAKATGIEELYDELRATSRHPSVLEYVEDLEGALRELSRIAGSSENLFIVNVQPWTATAWLYPGARWRGDVSSDASAGEMKAVSPGEKLLVGGVLGLTLAAALWPGGSEP